MTTFIGADGRVIDYLKLGDDGLARIAPDKYGAVQLLRAAQIGGDPCVVTDEFERILGSRPALPLLSGLIIWGMTFAEQIYGERAAEAFDQLALAFALKDGGSE